MKTGFICGAFDLLHAGHTHLFRQAKNKCDILLVGVHVDPSIERPSKNAPIESLLERQIKLISCEFVDGIIVYEKESDLKLIFDFYEIDIRFLGTDYLNKTKPITEEDRVPIEYISSLPVHTSDIRERIRK